MKESSPMPQWFRFSPKFTIPVPFIGNIVVEPSAAGVPLGGPPVSAGRYDRARRLVDETLAAIDATNLRPAADRLLALAYEFPVDQRGDAVRAANSARTFTDVMDRLPPEVASEQLGAALNGILAAIDAFRTTADQAEAALDPRAREFDGQPAGASSGSAVGHAVGPDDAAPAVACQGVGWRVGGKSILSDVDLTLARGSVVGVVGRNGAGKTTLLRLLAQEIRPSSGEVYYPDLSQRDYRGDRLLDRLAFVPQMPRDYTGGLEDHLRRFVALRGLRGDDLTGEVEFAMERFGLSGLASAPAGALSGGFRTRVELARATLAAPDVLLLDEPLGPLDSAAKRDYLRYLRDLADSRRQVCVVVTSQDVHAIAEIADTMIVIVDGEVRFAGDPDEIEHAVRRRSYEFAGTLSIDALQGLFAGAPNSELHDRGTTRLLLTDTTTSSGEVLDTLLRGGESVRYFRDLSHSAEQLLDDWTQGA